MVSERPKSSLIGMGDLAISAYNGVKIRNMSSEIDALTEGLNIEFQKHQSLISKTSRAIELVQNQTMSGLIAISSEVSKLNDRILGVERRLEKMDQRQEKVDALNLSVILIEEEIRTIRNLSTNYPEYSKLMAKNLLQITSELHISRFKGLSGEELRWVRDVLESVKTLDEDMTSILLG